MIYRAAQKKKWNFFPKKPRPFSRDSTRFSSSFALPTDISNTHSFFSDISLRHIKLVLYFVGIIVAGIIIWDWIPKKIISPLPKKSPIEFFFSSGGTL